MNVAAFQLSANLASCRQSSILPAPQSSVRLKFLGRRRFPATCAAAAAPAAEPAVAPFKLAQVLETLLKREDLTEQQTQQTLGALLDGAEAAQMAAFLVLLRAKGETTEEVAGLARAMLQKAVPVEVSCPGTDSLWSWCLSAACEYAPIPKKDTNSPALTVLDIVGTGGDGIGSVNISTGSTILAAAAGAKIAKTGNRSVSSLCGSADVLEALGVEIELGPDSVAQCIEEAGLGFMFAPRYNPAAGAVRKVRKALGVRTVFNLLGPLINPTVCPARYGLVGVFSPSISELMASVLQRLGVKRALVVHSHGLDELTPMGDAEVVDVGPNHIRSYRQFLAACDLLPLQPPFRLDPRDLGIPSCTVQDLKGGDAALNASILRDVFGGQQGHVADALCLNAGVALAAAEVAASPAEGVAMAQEVQRSGRAAQTLQRWVDISQACRQQELEAEEQVLQVFR